MQQRQPLRWRQGERLPLLQQARHDIRRTLATFSSCSCLVSSATFASADDRRSCRRARQSSDHGDVGRVSCSLMEHGATGTSSSARSMLVRRCDNAGDIPSVALDTASALCGVSA